VLTPLLFVVDLDRMTRFYAAGFGLSATHEAAAPGYRVLTGADCRLELHAVPEHVARRIAITDPPEPRSAAAIKLVFTVDDVATRAAQLERLGADIFATSTDDAVDGVDPEGNIFRVCLG
jgi:predicted enzyme related to lactoylglutathione lyase